MREESDLLFQRKYVLDLLNEIRILGAKPFNTPMILNVKPGLEDGEFLKDLKRYRWLVGKPNYLTITRLDIVFLVSVMSQFMISLRTFHSNVIMHILSYLMKTLGCRILYKNYGHCRVEGFSSTY